MESQNPQVKRDKPQFVMPLNVAPPGQCCDGTGWYLLAVPHGHPLFSVLQRCECGRAGNPDYRATKLRQRLHAYAHCTFDNWNIQRRLESFEYMGLNMNVEAQKKTLEIATNRAISYANNPKGWLYIYGSYGSGKTHLAAAIGLELAKKDLKVEYSSGQELITELRSAAGKYMLQETMQKYIDADLLILDDMGVEEMTSDFIHGQMWQIFDKRMEGLLIVTSNLDLPDLKEKVGNRIGSRLLQSSKVYLPLSDYRKYKGRESTYK
jgi:DNA replication protein DnaC